MRLIVINHLKALKITILFACSQLKVNTVPNLQELHKGDFVAESIIKKYLINTKGILYHEELHIMC